MNLLKDVIVVDVVTSYMDPIIEILELGVTIFEINNKGTKLTSFWFLYCSL